MRRVFWNVAIVCVALNGAASAALAQTRSASFYSAQALFQSLDVNQRILLQVLLVAGGYTNSVPTENFTGRTYKALTDFEVSNGFYADGRLDKDQIYKLFDIGKPLLAQWGFQKVTHPSRNVSIWAPLGLGLTMTTNASGSHYRDPLGRLSLDFVSVSDRGVADAYNELMLTKRREGATIHYSAFKDNWFVISTTTPDGADHYYRYHQDGSNVTGFALEWNNANGNVSGERIAVLMSASLGSVMGGPPLIDPPVLNASARPDQQSPPPAVAPTQIPSAPAPSSGFYTGTGFFVTDTGYFVTNAHVVSQCSEIHVKTDDNATNDAQRIAMDTTNDLALLKLAKTPSRTVALRIGARLGEGVEAFGFPHTDILSSSGNFTLGNITALNGIGDDSRYIQISAPVQAGNSGGPLLDQSGNLVGVVSSKLDAMKVAMNGGDLPQNVNFAVKSTMVAAFLDSNRVTYKIGTVSDKTFQPADIADQARAVSGFVVCR
jgi:hypothetical protein